MKKSNQTSKVDLNIPKPTEEEIIQTKKLVKDKFDIVVPKSEAIKLAKLTKELGWWVKADKPGSSRHISEKMALEFKELVKQVKGIDISTSVASDSARGLLVLVPLKEKQRISDEIRAILVTHREVLRDPIVTEKTAELLRLHYNLELNNDQLDQLIQLLSKKVWFEEGLNESLEKCLDDLIIYADKRKRGKRVNGLNLHDKIRQALDQAVNDLKLSGNKFNPLYREQD
jgi:hypothetical protein